MLLLNYFIEISVWDSMMKGDHKSSNGHKNAAHDYYADALGMCQIKS